MRLSNPPKKTPFVLSLSKPVLSACLGRQSKGAFSSFFKNKGTCFDKVSTNGFGGRSGV